MIMDNANPDILAIKGVDLKYVKMLLLSPNTTPKLQPLGCGIITNFKTKYRKKLIYELFT